MIHGNMGRKAWACSETSKECDDDDDMCCPGSLIDGLTARLRNRAASHLVRGANKKFHKLGVTKEPEIDGMAQSTVEECSSVEFGIP